MTDRQSEIANKSQRISGVLGKEILGSRRRNVFKRSAPVKELELEDLTQQSSTDQKIDSSLLNETKGETRQLILQEETKKARKIHQIRNKIGEEHSMEAPVINSIIKMLNYINIFSKGLSHDNKGVVNISQIERFLELTIQGDIVEVMKLNPQADDFTASLGFDFIGCLNNSYPYSTPYSFSSNELKAYMTELYAMSLARDIPFHQYRSNPTIQQLVKIITKMEKYPQRPTHRTTHNIFRGPTMGDIDGPYVSRFLHCHKYSVYQAKDYLTTWSQLLKCQNGEGSSNMTKDLNRYIACGRDLASIIHRVDPHQHAYNLFYDFIKLKIPKRPSLNLGYSHGGNLDILSVIFTVARNAYNAAAYIKWRNMAIRPEKIGMEVERIRVKGINEYRLATPPSDLLDLVHSKISSHLLSQVYDTGSPISPSKPSDLAALFAAVVTVFKFYFDVTGTVAAVELVDGKPKLNDKVALSIEGELHKWCNNLSFGTLWAGINTYGDCINGIKIGEQVAISCLQDIVHRYPYPISQEIKRFNGKYIKFSNF